MPALDNAIIERLRYPILDTWYNIASDLMSAAEAMGDELDNDAAIEGCIDANRLLLVGNDAEADKLVTTLCIEHGYGVVLRFLSQNFRLA
jgi:hypothetical protein